MGSNRVFQAGYFAQDHAAEFGTDMTLFEWISQWQPPGSDEQLLRATLGRMLFSRDDSEKSVKVVSGGEEGRLLFGKLLLQKHNVMVMDQPTNPRDMESIEALNLALANYPGTLIFISHDREFVASLATRIIELTPDGSSITLAAMTNTCARRLGGRILESLDRKKGCSGSR